MASPVLPEVVHWEKRMSLAVIHTLLVAQIMAGNTADICYVEELWGLKFSDLAGHEGILAKLKKGDTVFYIVVDRIWTEADASTSAAPSAASATPATIPATSMPTPATIPTTSTIIPPSTAMATYPPFPRANESAASVASNDSVSSAGNFWTSKSSSPSKNMKRVLSNKELPAGDEMTFYYADPTSRLRGCQTDLRYTSVGKDPEQGVIEGGVTLLLLLIIARSVSLELQDYRLYKTNCYMFRGLFEKTLERYLDDRPFEKSKVAGKWHGVPIVKDEDIKLYLNPAYERVKGFISEYTEKWNSKKEAEDQVKRQAERLAESERKVQELEALLAKARAGGGSQAENQL
ncbi:hypothetical protein E4T56_gene6197 [Termitomyces sp. T112]|nr:hypothetical protein E4T56_gene6197 [Termitomyces sp. T112]